MNLRASAYEDHGAGTLELPETGRVGLQALGDARGGIAGRGDTHCHTHRQETPLRSGVQARRARVIQAKA